MQGVYATCIDTRGEQPRLFVSGTSEHLGPGVYRSDDLGETWTEIAGAPVSFPADLGQQRRTGLADPTRPGRTSPTSSTPAPSRRRCSAPRTAASRSAWSARSGITRTGPWGAGFGGQAIHTVLPHPTDPAGSTVAMSTGGVYRTTDRGRTWNPANRGIKAYFFPDPWPEFGQCVHKVAAHPVGARADVRPEPSRGLSLR